MPDHCHIGIFQSTERKSEVQVWLSPVRISSSLFSCVLLSRWARQEAAHCSCLEAFIPGLHIHPSVASAVLRSLDRYFLSFVVFVYCSFVGFQIFMMVEGL